MNTDIDTSNATGSQASSAEDATQLLQDLRQLHDEGRLIKQRLEGILNYARIGISAQLVKDLADSYENQGNTNRSEARTSLKTAAGLGGAGIALAVYVAVEGPDPKATPSTIVGWASSRLLIVSILGVAIAFAIKNYNASKYHEIANRNRSLYMNSLFRLLEGASTPETRDAILVQAAVAIFSNAELSPYASPEMPASLVGSIPGASIVASVLKDQIGKKT